MKLYFIFVLKWLNVIVFSSRELSLSRNPPKGGNQTSTAGLLQKRKQDSLQLHWRLFEESRNIRPHQMSTSWRFPSVDLPVSSMHTYVYVGFFLTLFNPSSSLQMIWRIAGWVSPTQPHLRSETRDSDLLTTPACIIIYSKSKVLRGNLLIQILILAQQIGFRRVCE